MRSSQLSRVSRFFDLILCPFCPCTAHQRINSISSARCKHEERRCEAKLPQRSVSPDASKISSSSGRFSTKFLSPIFLLPAPGACTARASRARPRPRRGPRKGCRAARPSGARCPHRPWRRRRQRRRWTQCCRRRSRRGRPRARAPRAREGPLLGQRRRSGVLGGRRRGPCRFGWSGLVGWSVGCCSRRKANERVLPPPVSSRGKK